MTQFVYPTLRAKPIKIPFTFQSLQFLVLERYAFGIVRIMAIVVSFFSTLALGRMFNVQNLGIYYTLFTISYFGNAVFLVGFDYTLQAQIKDLQITNKLNKTSLMSYFALSSAIGCVATVFLAYIFLVRSDKFSIIFTVSACGMQSIAIYLSGVVRSILLISGRKVAFSSSLFIEQLLKLLAIYTVANLFEASPTYLLLFISISTLIGFCISCWYIFYSFEQCASKTYRLSLGIRSTSLPIAISGVFNWLQLQGYRMFYGAFLGLDNIVGQISYMFSLGTSSSSIFLPLIVQEETPRQFKTDGRSTKSFTFKIFFFSIIISILASLLAVPYLIFISKSYLIPFIPLIPMAIFQESVNVATGIFSNANAIYGRSFKNIRNATTAGVLTASIIFVLIWKFRLINAFSISIGIVASQTFVLLYLYLDFRLMSRKL